MNNFGLPTSHRGPSQSVMLGFSPARGRPPQGLQLNSPTTSSVRPVSSAINGFSPTTPVMQALSGSLAPQRVSQVRQVPQVQSSAALPSQRLEEMWPLPTTAIAQSNALLEIQTTATTTTGLPVYPITTGLPSYPRQSRSPAPRQPLQAMPVPSRQGPQRLRQDVSLERTETQPFNLQSVPSQQAASMPLAVAFSMDGLVSLDCVDFEMRETPSQSNVCTSSATVFESAEIELNSPPKHLASTPVEESSPMPQSRQNEAEQACEICEDQDNKVPPLPPLSMSLTKPPPELPPQLLSEYEGDPELLGEGAFAVVSRLRHRRNGELVALKVVEKLPLHIRDMLPQLQREVRIQGALVHKHILRLLSVLEDDTYVYMLLEYCPGGSLRSLCMTLPHQRLPEEEAAWFFAQILQGVEFMHEKNCVHRDLKPENMLLTGDNEVRICDFGWSAEVQVEQALMTTCGTPHYWAPEIFEAKPQGTPVDLWSLGALVYELIVGHAPFWGNMEELRAKVLAVDIRYPPGLLSNEAINLFYCLMQYEPRNRLPVKRLLTEHPWIQAALAVLCSDDIIAPPGTLIVTADTTQAKNCILVPVYTMSGMDELDLDVEGSSTVLPIGSSSISAQESAVAAAMAAMQATAAAKSAVNAERRSGPLPNPVWSTGPSTSILGPKALSAVPRNMQTEALEAPVVAPAVRPASGGRGNAMALSAALIKAVPLQPPPPVPGAIDWHTPEKD